MTTLRRALRDAGVEARVVKNRLFQLAAQQAGMPDARRGRRGADAASIFGYGDIVAPAKAIADYMRTARNTFAPEEGVHGRQRRRRAASITELASLPSREELIGKLAGAFVSPVQQFANLHQRQHPVVRASRRCAREPARRASVGRAQTSRDSSVRASGAQRRNDMAEG